MTLVGHVCIILKGHFCVIDCSHNKLRPSNVIDIKHGLHPIQMLLKCLFLNRFLKLVLQKTLNEIYHILLLYSIYVVIFSLKTLNSCEFLIIEDTKYHSLILEHTHECI